MIHFPQKINYVPQFLKQWDINSYKIPPDVPSFLNLATRQAGQLIL